ncbi:MAG: acyltransferase [Henriciella sp.]
MSRGFSIYLDAIRFLASVVVLVSHVGYPRYSNGDLIWIRELNLGSDAVVLFFVLSGFVIAYTTLAKRRTGATYAKARMSRLYSVLIPALVVTVLCDYVGRTINPEAYAGWWYNGEAVLHQLSRALTFTTQAAGDTLRVGTNGPFWSVAYEAWYYAAFGVAIFMRGWARIAVLAVMAVFAGLSILLLAPCWLAGMALYKMATGSEAVTLNARAAWMLAIGPWVVYAIFLAVDLPNFLSVITYLAMGANVTPNEAFGFADEFLWNYVLAGLFAVHFLGVYHLAKEGHWVSPKAETWIRWLAGATFSIYLFHYPVLTLLYAMPGYDAANPLHYGGAGVVTLVICFLLAEISERRLSAWRTIMDKLFSAVRSPVKRAAV